MSEAAAQPVPHAARHAVAWADVRGRGRVEEDRRPDGSVRWRLAFHEGGQRIRIYGRPSPASHQVRPFATRAEAEATLQEIRGEAVSRDWPLERVLGLWRPQAAPQDLVEVRLEEHLQHWRGLVAGGHRSPRSLTELERYDRPEGHFGWWFGRSIHAITYGEVEDWHRWLARRGVGPKTQKNVSDAFRAFLRRLCRREEIEEVPDFPTIRAPQHAPQLLELATLERVLAAIPWDRRGAFLACAYEALRPGEVRALETTDFREGRLRVGDAMGGLEGAAPKRGRTKTDAAEWRAVWHPELQEWLAWRLDQAREERMQGRATALFWNPTARNPARRFAHYSMWETWQAACRAAGVAPVPLQEGTRSSFLTRASEELPERLLRAFSRHRDWRSLDHYAKPRASREAMLRVLGRHEEE